MPKEYLILDAERQFKQDAWAEEQDSKGRIIKPVRPARDEVEIQVRMDRMFRAHLRLPISLLDTTTNRRKVIAGTITKLGLGEEIAPGVQVVEVETRFTEARQAMVTSEQKDEQGNITRPESFSPAQPERTDVSFSLRIDGLHLQKVSLDEAELSQPNWKTALASKVSQTEVFSR